MTHDVDDQNEQPPIVKATQRAAGREMTAQLVRTAVSHQMDDEPGGSALVGMLQVAEAAEKGLTAREGNGARPHELTDRFPELRDVEIPTGNEARFPELFAPTPSDSTDQAESDEEYGR